jgi:hypothetical protein
MEKVGQVKTSIQIESDFAMQDHYKRLSSIHEQQHESPSRLAQQQLSAKSQHNYQRSSSHLSSSQAVPSEENRLNRSFRVKKSNVYARVVNFPLIKYFMEGKQFKIDQSDAQQDDPFAKSFSSSSNHSLILE